VSLARNKYLVRNGRDVGSRLTVAILSFVPLFGSLLLVPVGLVLVEAVTAVGVLCCVVGILGFFATTVFMWVALLTGGKNIERATHALRAGDAASALTLCQVPLARVFRSDIRTRALYVLGLVAESNADFAEAEDLFARANASMPALAAAKYQRYGRVLIHCHRALALVALHRLDEADLSVRQATALFPPPAAPGVLDALTDDAGFGALGVAAALQRLEQGRDPRPLLTLACATVLAARGMAREALELIHRESYSINAGLPPHERALASNVEARAHSSLGGGPMRSAALVAGSVGGGGHPWADRILPPRVG
jgi:hypothetical protein